MELLHDLWTRVLASDLYWLLPEWLREPPGLYLLAGAVVSLPAVLLWRLAAGRRPRGGRQVSSRKTLSREIRDCRRRGDHLGAGRRYEALGKPRAALRAYRRGSHHAEAADLLLRRGKTEKAKAVAREGGEWETYADLCEAAGELAEAGVAHERAGRAYAAAGCYERAGMPNEAAHCFLQADMHSKAIELLMADGSGASAESLETALRAALRDEPATRGATESDPRRVSAVRRCAQLWIEEGDAERAYRLAIDSGQADVAVPIARDHLPPRADTAEACASAGAHLVAAEIYRRFGDRRREALARAEHHQQHEQAAEAARWFEIAEEWDLAAEHWAATGEPLRAAELFARSGNFETAARLFAGAGDTVRHQDMMARASAAGGSAGDRLESGSQLSTEPSMPRAPIPSASPPDERSAADDATGARYRLGEELGRGGMGVVYRAEDLLLKRAVAYKVLLKERLADPGEAERLLVEARAAARLSHPNIVQVYDAGRDESGFFIVMELVEGENFSKLLESRKLSVAGAIRVGRQVCAALAHAHERRLIHRDLKPSNLIWTADRRVKLTDFGLARAFDAAGKIVTRPAGTPYYMAPEQIRGEGVDPRSDLYSFGCVLYELLTRHGPFGGGSSIHHHLQTPPDDPRTWRKSVPEELAELVLRCLEKDPENRPASARDVGRSLAELGR